MVRGGLRRVLDAEADLRVVAEAGDVEMALRETRDHQPRVVVLDLNMPGIPTLDAIPDFLDAAPDCAVLVLTMDDEPASAKAAMSSGAAGYVLKEAAEAELVEAVRALLAGRTYLDPSLGARLARSDGGPREPMHAVTAAEPESAVGSSFAEHRIDAVVGRGGMGVVFRATDLALARTVALKVIASQVGRDRLFQAHFARECRLAARIEHPHVVPIYSAGEAEGVAYLTMRYVDGPDLGGVIRREERLDAPRAVALLSQIAGALDEAHRLGVVHLDVKPANVLIDRRGKVEHSFLTDFGLTKPLAEDSATETTLALGTIDYMAPERAQGLEVDGHADVYSLGCLLFHMLTGRVVFERDNDLAKIWSHVNGAPPKLRSHRPELPESLEQALARALSKEPGQRQGSPGELARDAAEAISGSR